MKKIFSLLLTVLMLFCVMSVPSFAYTNAPIYDSNYYDSHTIDIGSDVTIVGNLSSAMVLTNTVDFAAYAVLGHLNGSSSSKIVAVNVLDDKYTTHQYYVYTYRAGYTNSVISNLSTSSAVSPSFTTIARYDYMNSRFVGQATYYNSMQSNIHIRTKLSSTEGYYAIPSITTATN